MLSQYSLERWDTHDGLPSDAVLALQRGSDGYLWVGTAAGLARFDGVQLDRYSTANVAEFNNDEVRCLLTDSAGTLWIGFRGGGVVRLAAGRFTRFTQNEGLGSDSAYRIAQSKDGRLWFAAGRVVTALEGDRASDASAAFRTEGDSFGNLAYDGSTDTMWTASRVTLFAIQGGEARAVQLPGGVALGRVTALLASSAGELWVGTSAGGVLRRSEGNIERYTVANGLPSNRVRVLLKDREGSVWVGTTAGLVRIARRGLEVMGERDGLPHGSITALHEDAEGSLWVGTNGGLVRLKEGLFTSFTRAEGLVDDTAAAVAETADGSIWVGTDGGLARIRGREVANFTTRDGLPAGGVQALWPDSRGGLWIAGEGGHVLWDGTRIRATPGLRALDGSVDDRPWGQAVLERDGWLWASVAQKLRRMRLTDGLVEHFERKGGLHMAATVLSAGTQGRVWVGTFNGLGETDGTSTPRIHEIYKTRDGLSSGVIYGIVSDEDGTLWLATRDRGLVRFRNGEVRIFDRAAGLPADDLCSVIDDGIGYLWCGSGQGIIRIARESLEQYDRGQILRLPCLVYDTVDGLRSAAGYFAGSPGAWRSRDGRLWFCTRRGVAVVDPRRAGADERHTPLAFRAIVTRRVRIADPVDARIEAGQNDIEIHYAGLNLLAPEKTHFGYRLEGVDHDWVDAGTRRVAYYTALSPGRYAFELRAKDAARGLEPGVARLSFTIAPKWHETRWWRGLLALLAVGVVVFAYRIRVAALEQRARALAANRQERERLIADLEKRNEELERFTYSVSHDLRTPLVTVRGFAGLLEVDLAAGETDKVARDLARIASATDTMERLLKGLLEISKVGLVSRPIEAVALDDVASEVLAMMSETLRQAGVEVKFGGGLPVVRGDRMRLLEVFQNLVENALKFRRRKGAAEVEIGARPGAAGPVTFIRDNGVGIEPVYLDRIFALFERLDPDVEGTGVGLALVKRIVEAHHGRVWAESEGVGRGATFCVALPLAPPAA